MKTPANRDLSQQYHAQEILVSQLAATPVETARRLVQAQAALKKIESDATQAIYEYGITQEAPDKWMALGDLVRNMMAPIRDAARFGLKR
jgi:hypothetical protein